MTYKALVIEDDKEIIAQIEDALSSLEHLWDIVASQEEALKRLKAGEYDYMLLAISIRARAGNGQVRIQNTENLLEKMSQITDRPLPQIIVMSDHQVEGLKKSVDLMRMAMYMSRCGVVDVIAKPFPGEGRTLDRVVKKVLGLNGNGTRVPGTGAAGTSGARAGSRGTAPAEDRGLTGTAAARLLMKDIPRLTLDKARSRVSTAAGEGDFKSSGTGRNRRIDPESFDAWRLKQRDRDLDLEDKDDFR